MKPLLFSIAVLGIPMFQKHMPSQDPPFQSTGEDPYKALAPYKWKIYAECQKWGVPPDIAMRLIMVESEGNQHAWHQNLNGSEDFGLFQLNNRTFHRYSQFELWNPDINIPLGVEYLSDCYEKAGNWYDSLLIYNCGHVKGAPVASHRYVQRILGGKE